MKRILIPALIALGLLCTMAIWIQTAKATLPDLNLDGMVNMEDIGRVAAAFGSHFDDLQWDPLADLDANGQINMWDVGCVARQFGQMSEHHSPPVEAPPFETPPTPPFETPPVEAPPFETPP